MHFNNADELQPMMIADAGIEVDTTQPPRANIYFSRANNALPASRPDLYLEDIQNRLETINSIQTVGFVKRIVSFTVLREFHHDDGKSLLVTSEWTVRATVEGSLRGIGPSTFEFFAKGQAEGVGSSSSLASFDAETKAIVDASTKALHSFLISGGTGHQNSDSLCSHDESYAVLHLSSLARRVLSYTSQYPDWSLRHQPPYSDERSSFFPGMSLETDLELIESNEQDHAPESSASESLVDAKGFGNDNNDDCSISSDNDSSDGSNFSPTSNALGGIFDFSTDYDSS